MAAWIGRTERRLEGKIVHGKLFSLARMKSKALAILGSPESAAKADSGCSPTHQASCIIVISQIEEDPR